MQLKPGESGILNTFAGKDVDVEKWVYTEISSDQTALYEGWKFSFINSEPAIDQTFQLDSLGSWTELDNATVIKNMGTGRYSITFPFKKNENSEYLQSLGDVRESARVTVNDKDAGVLFAVPFETRIGSLLEEGKNTIEIDVTNLPANRIADYDRNGVEWRIFKEINFVDIKYKATLYDNWGKISSGLLGPVFIKELTIKKP